MDTRYLPATAAALAVGVAVSVGFVVTHNVGCINGLFALFFISHLLPRTRTLDDEE